MKTLSSNLQKAALCLIVSLISMSAISATLINGAGATFPYPLYSKWMSEYRKVDPEIQINYNSIGSGGGIRQLMDKTIDFGASDTPMTDEQLSKAEPKIYHIPTVLGAVVITFNLPDFKGDLKLTGDLISKIYLGTIKKWSDPELLKLNPGLKNVGDQFIVPVYRSDGSGTTAIFTDYLKKVNKEWESKVGTGTSVKWPQGLGAKGNEGVTGLVKNTKNSVGYVELIYAETNKMSSAQIKNSSGEFVKANMQSVTEAAAGSLKSMPDDFRVSITDATGKKAYPISSFTYLLVYQEMDNPKAEKIKKFIRWAISSGQKYASELKYAPLPQTLATKVGKRIDSVVAKAAAK